MPQINPFASHRRGLQSPATHHLSVTPQNAVDLPVRPRVLTSGGLSLRDEAGTVITCAVTVGETIGVSAVGVERTAPPQPLRGGPEAGAGPAEQRRWHPLPERHAAWPGRQALRRHASEGGIAAVDMVGPAGFEPATKAL